MVKIAFDSSFKRAFKRKIAGNLEREERFWTKLELFKNNPFEATLKTHKLSEAVWKLIFLPTKHTKDTKLKPKFKNVFIFSFNSCVSWAKYRFYF